MILRFFASTPKGTEGLLARELRALGGTKIRVQSAGVAFAGTLETGYRALSLREREVNAVILIPSSQPSPGGRRGKTYASFYRDRILAVEIG